MRQQHEGKKKSKGGIQFKADEMNEHEGEDSYITTSQLDYGKNAGNMQ